MVFIVLPAAFDGNGLPQQLAQLTGLTSRVYDTNLSVYGADKIWTQLNRENIVVARCTIERLMRQMGLAGARRGRSFKVTTSSDDRLPRGMPPGSGAS